jgi:hypothetical protein
MRFHAGAGSTRSNSMRGRISPKVTAMIIRDAVAPLVAMLVSTVETASTLPMSTPSGLAGTICETGAASSSTVNSPPVR